MQRISVFVSVRSWISLVPYFKISGFAFYTFSSSMSQWMADSSGIVLDAILVMASRRMFTILSSMPNRVSGTAECFFPCLLMPGPWMPPLQWMDDDREQWEPAAQKPRLERRPTNPPGGVENGELLKVWWPADASPSIFGPLGAALSFARLKEEGERQGIHFKMRHNPGRNPKEKKGSAQLDSTSKNPYLLQVSGPLGTTREFYEDVRKIMATRRQSWAGLLHPRKLTLLTVKDWHVQNEMPAEGSACSAIATGQQTQPDEPADDTDEGEPPCDDDLVFKKMENLFTGRRPESPSEVPLPECVPVQFPSQSAERDDPAYWDFHLLLGEARSLFEVV